MRPSDGSASVGQLVRAVNTAGRSNCRRATGWHLARFTSANQRNEPRPRHCELAAASAHALASRSSGYSESCANPGSD